MHRAYVPHQLHVTLATRLEPHTAAASATSTYFNETSTVCTGWCSGLHTAERTRTQCRVVLCAAHGRRRPVQSRRCSCTQHFRHTRVFTACT